MTPTISIQILGLVFKHKARLAEAAEAEEHIVIDDTLVIELDEKATTAHTAELEIIDFDIRKFIE